MYHCIEFTGDLVADIGYSRADRLEQIRIHKGTQLLVQLKPYVQHTDHGPVEMADLFLEDGSTLCEVAYEYFFFVE